MTDGPWHLARLTTEDDAHINEFAAQTIEEAVGQAVLWHADRTNHGAAPTNRVLLKRMGNDRSDWITLARLTD